MIVDLIFVCEGERKRNRVGKRIGIEVCMFSKYFVCLWLSKFWYRF